MEFMEKVLHYLLAYATAYAIYVIDKSHLNAVIACGIGFMYSILLNIQDNSESLVHDILRIILEVATLPLINIELYKYSSLDRFAKMHYIFLLPLILDIIARIKDNKSEAYYANTLSDFIILGNLCSTFYLGYVENNLMIKILGTIAMANTYGSLILNGIYEGAGEPLFMIGYSTFFYIVSKCTSHY